MLIGVTNWHWPRDANRTARASSSTPEMRRKQRDESSVCLGHGSVRFTRWHEHHEPAPQGYLGNDAIAAGILLRSDMTLEEATACFAIHEDHNPGDRPCRLHCAKRACRAPCRRDDGHVQCVRRGPCQDPVPEAFRHSTRILVRDGFKRQRNADYPALEEFFGLHVTYEEAAWQGWRSWSTPWGAPWRCDALIAPFYRCSDDATTAACVPQAKLLERGISQPINCAPGGNFSDLHKSLPPAVGLRQTPVLLSTHICASHGRHRLLMAQGRMRTSLLGDEASQSVAVLIFPGFPMMAFSSII